MQGLLDEGVLRRLPALWPRRHLSRLRLRREVLRHLQGGDRLVAEGLFQLNRWILKIVHNCRHFLSKVWFSHALVGRVESLWTIFKFHFNKEREIHR